ncbi:TPA: A/G-specific adenine glycosylase [Candidatus Peribacteria bacterium]|nr:MAG: hypothetical protein A3J91_02300 [Candidatus Peribacteria bacterium RIFOXYC2_FULL_58_10]OGJ84006.1 MAG: hypothetical protein A2529_04385 [Candidatus Peribacteria bacterium RIFOXYD2_FULL_58_15]HAI98733.1 A/G-specific adenine glycosylase [Candidatus Peribacteria bacterium]HAS34147.1 A/G-specific adenine glycosylase [Candidatus Peribacteria bacterium]
MAGFVNVIWEWYASHKRTLPWRDLTIEDETQRAYRILVSEVMLQQTQVERVKVMYRTFLERFPTLSSLAGASNRDVLLAWRGMGYNSRALRLRDAACSIEERFGGEFPKEMDQLSSIKGIGPYTAAAIRNFAFNLPTPCIDTNIRRILHRTFVGPEERDGMWEKDDRSLLRLAEEVVKMACDGGRHDAANWHAALMDFGSLVQTKSNPRWHLCPLTRLGLMKATPKAWERRRSSFDGLRMTPSERRRSEPGREIAGKFVPNRIIRGRIIDELRDEEAGLRFDELGRRVCIDWSPRQHRAWLKAIVDKLAREQMLQQIESRYSLQP